ncbi:MAG: histidine phosphatase family protein [Alphaproteobacteria bacterium]|nr:histidine phosphatase family protein [Alphaproteobacteria bacterium]
MCSIFLVRHGEHPLIGTTLVGRDNASVHLSDQGWQQARELATLLGDRDIECIQSSPRVRCLETAGPLADRLGLPVHVHDALDEIDFGDWTGLTFEALEQDPQWYMWNASRARARAPGGETIMEACTRAMQHVEQMCIRYPSKAIAMFTHAELIRAVRLHQRGLSPDAWHSVEVPPVSITELWMWPSRSPTPAQESIFAAAAS